MQARSAKLSLRNHSQGGFRKFLVPSLQRPVCKCRRRLLSYTFPSEVWASLISRQSSSFSLALSLREDTSTKYITRSVKANRSSNKKSDLCADENVFSQRSSSDRGGMDKNQVEVKEVYTRWRLLAAPDKRKAMLHELRKKSHPSLQYLPSLQSTGVQLKI